jgi:Rrf2 family protein
MGDFEIWPALPKRVHYALKSLCCLASGEGPFSAQQVAQFAAIPRAEAAKILYVLTWGGFVRSRRGSKGGFWLRRPPQSILVADVVRFLSTPPDRQAASSKDLVLQVWQHTVALRYDVFGRLSLERLMHMGNAEETSRHSGASEAHARAPKRAIGP